MTELEQLSPRDTLLIVLDLADPYCQLALPGTLELAAQSGVTTHWRAFERPALTPPAAQQWGEDRGTAHRRQRAEYREWELRYYAAARGLPLERLYEVPDRGPFASALAWLQNSQTPSDFTPSEFTPSEFTPSAVIARFLQVCFQDYWSAALDQPDSAAMATRLSASGADGARWQSSHCRNHALTAAAAEQVAEQTAQLRAAGLFNTPAYVLDEDVYYGRAHLPLLHTLLTER